MIRTPTLALLATLAVGCTGDSVNAPTVDDRDRATPTQAVEFVGGDGIALEKVVLVPTAEAGGDVRIVHIGLATSRPARRFSAPGDRIFVAGDYCSPGDVICDRITSVVTSGGTPAGRWLRGPGPAFQFEGTPTCQGVLADDIGPYMYVVGQTGPTDAQLAFYYGDGAFGQASTPTFDQGCDDRVISFTGALLRGTNFLAEGDRLRTVF